MKKKIVRSHSLALGANGVASAEEARQLLYGCLADIATGAMDPDRAHPMARLADTAAKTHANQLKEREIALRERDQMRRFKLLEAEAQTPKALTHAK